MPALRRCVAPGEATVLVTRCHRPGRPVAGIFLLLLTDHRLVVTRESRWLHRVRLHLDADLRSLTDVTWSADAGTDIMELAVTTAEGIRERFWFPVRDPRVMRRLDAQFSHVFRSRTVPPGTLPRARPRLFRPAGAF